MKHFFPVVAHSLVGPLRTAGLVAGLGLLALPALAQSLSPTTPPPRPAATTQRASSAPLQLAPPTRAGASRNQHKAAGPTVTGVSPARNTATASRTSNVSFTLSEALNAGSANAIRVFGSRGGGLLPGTGSVSGSTVTFNPTPNFQPGETVYATLTTAAQNTSGQPLAQGEVVSFIAAASKGTGTYTAAPSLTAAGSFGAAVGDLNSDGIMDVVLSSIDNSTLLTYIGTGGGGFAAPVSIATGALPTQVVLADVDNDGDLDAVVPSFSAGGTSVHRNVGGVLGAATLLPTGANPRNVAVVDVDGDGDLDILTNNISSNNVTLNVNTTGTFAAATTAATTGLSPYGLAAADFNGDGTIDFATADANSDILSIRLGVGDGTFTVAPNVNPGAAPFGVAAGDLNGDNLADLVTCNRNGNTVAVALGVGDGTFATPTTVTVGTQPIDVSLADVDADGDLDLLVANYGGNNLTVRRNSGSGTFPTATNYAAVSQPPVIISGDLNGDGALDIVTTNTTSTTVTVLYNGASLPDLVVSTPANIPAGAYNSITVTGTGVGTVTGAVSVVEGIVVESGGVLITNCQIIGGEGDFTLEAGAELRICSPAGITSSGATGAVQVTGTRSYSDEASYTYNGTLAQVTGNGLPGKVRNLTVNNGSNVSLSAPTSVARLLTLTSGNLNTSSQTFTLLSNMDGTAMVVNTDGVVNGTATMQRYILSSNEGLGYRHYSSPVMSTTVADLATSNFTPVVNPAYNASTKPGSVKLYPTVFAYDEQRLESSPATMLTPFSKGWFSPASLGSTLEPGRGYSVNLPGTAQVDFVGTLNNGTIARTGLTRTTTDATSSGWHLLGNPYPSPIDWSVLSQDGASGLNGAVYIFASSGQYSGNYSSFVNGVPFGGQNIAAAQGFFVRVTEPSTTGSLTFRNAARLTTYANPAFKRGSGEQRPLVQLELRGNGRADVAYAYWEQGATTGFDAKYDAVKFPVATSLSLALAAGAEELSISGLPALTPGTTMEVALLVSVPVVGEYTLHPAQLLNLPAGLKAYLRDAQSGQLTDLGSTPTYAFSATQAGRQAPRFTLVVSASGVLATAPAALREQVGLYPNPARDAVQVLLPTSLQAKPVAATVVNSLGQTVRRQTLSGRQPGLSLRGLAPGVYTVQLYTPQGVVAKRLVVK